MNLSSTAGWDRLPLCLFVSTARPAPLLPGSRLCPTRTVCRTHPVVHPLAQLTPVLQEEWHVVCVDVVQGYAQLARQHSQGVAVYACDDAATQVSNCGRTATLCTHDNKAQEEEEGL